MTQANVYLMFNGNCREAMNFYKESLQGKLTFQTVGDSPMAGQMPPQMKDSILHSTLTKDALTIMASDMEQENLINGNGYQINITSDDEKELNSFFSKMSDGGKIKLPFGNMPWGAKLGMLTDKFGKNWMFSFDKRS
ncbi:MAG TPA: VOC family protein [Chitinophagaceae bacterium]|nr:VOC family protein [Chitinophagaceae bacterium]